MRELSHNNLTCLVTTVSQFDRLMTDSLSELMTRASGHVRRFLKDTGQWSDDVVHEKLATRWGFEMLERFLVCGRSEVPCRPLLLLDSFIMKSLSQPEPFCYHEDLCSPLGRFLEGLAARAVVSRDALVALFHHQYGLGQSDIVRLLRLDITESQRVYKNFERWRRSGWQRAIQEIGLTDEEVAELEDAQRRDRRRFHAQAAYLLGLVQDHYRKSDPEHFRCRSVEQWADLYAQNYGQEYRIWHLAMCSSCARLVDGMHQAQQDDGGLEVRVNIRPLTKHTLLAISYSRGHNGTSRRADRLSRHSA